MPSKERPHTVHSPKTISSLLSVFTGNLYRNLDPIYMLFTTPFGLGSLIASGKGSNFILYSDGDASPTPTV